MIDHKIKLKKFFLFTDERERESKGGEREKERDRQTDKHRFVAPPICALIGWFLYVPWLEIEPATVVHEDDALTNEATRPGRMWN